MIFFIRGNFDLIKYHLTLLQQKLIGKQKFHHKYKNQPKLSKSKARAQTLLLIGWEAPRRVPQKQTNTRYQHKVRIIDCLNGWNHRLTRICYPKAHTPANWLREKRQMNNFLKIRIIDCLNGRLRSLNSVKSHFATAPLSFSLINNQRIVMDQGKKLAL